MWGKHIVSEKLTVQKMSVWSERSHPYWAEGFVASGRSEKDRCEGGSLFQPASVRKTINIGDTYSAQGSGNCTGSHSLPVWFLSARCRSLTGWGAPEVGHKYEILTQPPLLMCSAVQQETQLHRGNNCCSGIDVMGSNNNNNNDEKQCAIHKTLLLISWL